MPYRKLARQLLWHSCPANLRFLPDNALNASVLLWGSSPGMKGGQAIAEILLGLTNPSGRLPITFPRHAGQLPVYYNQIRGQHGNRSADLTQDPSFAFNEGCSYTTFAYGDVEFAEIAGKIASVEDITSSVCAMPDTSHTEREMIPVYKKSGTIHAQISLANTGNREGAEVVQAYIGDIVTSVSWTDRELKAFRRVTLQPGQTQVVKFEIPVSECSIADAHAQRIVENGEFELLIDHSSKCSDLKRDVFAVEDAENEKDQSCSPG